MRLPTNARLQRAKWASRGGILGVAHHGSGVVRSLDIQLRQISFGSARASAAAVPSVRSTVTPVGARSKAIKQTSRPANRRDRGGTPPGGGSGYHPGVGVPGRCVTDPPAAHGGPRGNQHESRPRHKVSVTDQTPHGDGLATSSSRPNHDHSNEPDCRQGRHADQDLILQLLPRTVSRTRFLSRDDEGPEG